MRKLNEPQLAAPATKVVAIYAPLPTTPKLKALDEDHTDYEVPRQQRESRRPLRRWQLIVLPPTRRQARGRADVASRSQRPPEPDHHEARKVDHPAALGRARAG